MQLTITQQHIDDGIRNTIEACPISHALRSRYPNAYGINVGTVDAEVYLALGKKHYTLGDDAQRFIDAFDAERPVQPCTLTLHNTTDGG